MVINTNVSALLATNALNNTTTQTQNVLQELSTGYRINSASDDPAGYAIAAQMNGQVNGLNQANQNAQQANTLLQIASGGLQQDQQILQKVRSLAVEASNSTLTSNDRNNIQGEINQLVNQVDNNQQNTVFNSISLLNGSFGASVSGASVTGTGNVGVVLGADTANVTAATQLKVSVSQATVNGQLVDTANLETSTGTTVASTSVVVAGGSNSTVLQFVDQNVGGQSISLNISASSLTAGGAATVSSFTVTPASTGLNFQVGANQGGSNTLAVNIGNLSAKALGLQDANGTTINVSTAQGAENAISTVDNAVSMLSSSAASIGAYQNQLSYTMSNLSTESTNLQSAYSTIMDVNMASAMTKFTQDQVLEQSGESMLSQAQAMPSMVLKLLS